MNRTPQSEEQDSCPSTEGRHIALYMEAFTGGGAERVMVNLAAGLAARGHRVDMIVVRAEGPYLALLPPDVRLIDLGCRRSLASLPRLARYLRRERPDALLSAIEHSNLIALWASAAAGYRGRVVVSVHINLSTVIRRMKGISRRLFLFLYRRFYSDAAAVVAVSHGAAADLDQLLKLPPGRVRMIYNPVVSPVLIEQAKEPVEHPWFQNGQPPVILAVGRLCPQKDFPTLLRAFALLHARTPARLVILGEGPDRPALEAQAAALGLDGAVALPGFAANPYAHMARAGACALSSRWEGLPTVLIEAMACGAPVVATDCPSGPREALGGGRYGALVPVGDAGALAAALEAALGGGRRAAPAESWAPFHIHHAAQQYEQILLNDLPQSRGLNGLPGSLEDSVIGRLPSIVEHR